MYSGLLMAARLSGDGLAGSETKIASPRLIASCNGAHSLITQGWIMAFPASDR
jgi:hypothetical protein